MKRFIAFILAVAAAAVLTSCNAEKDTATPSAEPTQTYVSTPSPTETITPEPTLSPMPQQKLSYTTGLPFEGEYKPVIAVIENSRPARPQTGLQAADVVYEVPVEGGITRLVCVFSDNVPSEIMPVRSCRVPFLYIQHEWDAVFMHYGGSGKSSSDRDEPYSVYGHKLYKQIKYHVDGLSGYAKYYKRVKGKKTPHNVMGFPDRAQKLYDYEPEPIGWLFDADAAYAGEDVLSVDLKLCSNDKNYVSYDYDGTNDIYLRSMNGKTFTSAETKQQVGVKNVIVLYSTYKKSVSGIKLWNLVGSGKADFYIGGKRIKGSWERKSEDDKTVFYDDRGEQIVLRPGNTWIHLSPSK